MGNLKCASMNHFNIKSAGQLETYPTIGKLGEYGGGGYIIRLKGAQKDIQDTFKKLQSLRWIDKYTRAVMVEFSVYNANVNLFATATIIARI